jgi:RNA polymerase sigma-70 factor (ECF subfamily)
VPDTALPQLVENVFRHRYGDMVAGLCRVLGPGRLDLVEDVVQEATLRALRRWPVEGVPERPEAWLFRVARNLALDSLRRRAVGARIETELSLWATAAEVDDGPGDGVADDTLRMIFTCSHPEVPAETRLALVLKTVCSFGTGEIAAALLQKEGTVAQRLTRAKARLQGGLVRFEVPSPAELPARLPLVLEVLYLLFNEGYRSHRGRDLVRGDLVEEAVRLCGLLLEQPATAIPEVHALLALMLFLGARLPARTDALGELLTLAEQDRSLWDRDWLHCAFVHFRASIGGERMTAYHVEAAIASLHAAAPDYAATDWRRILLEYDRLLQLTDTPVVRLNRVVAVAKVHGAAAGLAALAEVTVGDALADYVLLPATAAQLHWSMGSHEAAAACLQRALSLPCSEPEQRLLQRRLLACQRGEAVAPW